MQILAKAIQAHSFLPVANSDVSVARNHGTDNGRRFDDKDAGLPVVPDSAQPSPQESIGRSQFRSFDGALQNAELVAESQDLELQRRTAPHGSENSGPESRQ